MIIRRSVKSEPLKQDGKQNLWNKIKGYFKRSSKWTMKTKFVSESVGDPFTSIRIAVIKFF